MRKIKAPAWPVREKTILNAPAPFPSLQSTKLPRPLCAAGLFFGPWGCQGEFALDQGGGASNSHSVQVSSWPGRGQMKGFSTDKLPSWGWRIVIALAVFALAMFLFCPKAFSQDTRRGEQLAKTWCVSCHSVDSNGAELRNDAVPSFAAISSRPETSQKSLEAYLRSKHPRMPAYGLKQTEIRDVVAYIVSLNPAANKPNQGRTRP